MNPKAEGLVTAFPTPDELLHKTFSDENDWKSKFDDVITE